MRRLLAFLAVIVVLAGGGVAAYVVHRLRSERNVVGSSTVEFTQSTPKPAKPPLGVEWPMYGYDAARTRAASFPLRPPFRRLWVASAGSLVEFPPSIGYGRLYFSTGAGHFLAVNAKTGKRAWTRRIGRCVAASPAVGPDGSVYAAFLNTPPCNRRAGDKGIDGEVIDFAAGFGKIRWRKRIGPTESSPLLVGRRLYVGDWNGDVWALDARDGRTLWRFHAGGAVKGGVAYANGRLYVGAYDGRLYCLSPRGTLLWRASGQGTLLGGGHFYSTPAVAYGRVYIGSTDGKVYSFGAESGKLIWSHGTGGYVYASPAVAHDLVFAGSYSRTFYALDAATGLPRWTFAADGQISGSATVIGRVVYFATLSGTTYALATGTGKLLWRFADGKYTPVVATKERLYLVGYGRVYGMVPRQ